jgi:uncharacterized DUF497 family protein
MTVESCAVPRLPLWRAEKASTLEVAWFFGSMQGTVPADGAVEPAIREAAACIHGCPNGHPLPCGVDRCLRCEDAAAARREIELAEAHPPVAGREELRRMFEDDSLGIPRRLFEEATSMFEDPSLAYFADLDQPDRFIAIGYSALARMLVVVHLEMGDTIRIISARKASRHERKVYAKERS